MVSVISCKNSKEKNTDKIEQVIAIENDSTPVSTKVEAQKDSSIKIVEKQIIKKQISPKYQYGTLIRRLKGNVKQVISNTYYSYKTLDGKIVPDTDSEYWYNFSISYHKDGKRKEDDFGRNSGGAAFMAYKFDSAGNSIKIAYYDLMSDDTISIIKCKYDQQNNLLEERYYEYGTGVPQDFSLYVYDQRNNLIQQTFYNPDNKMLTKRIWNYNIANDEISFYEYRFEQDKIVSELNNKYSYEYDSFGNWIFQIVYENDNISQIEYRQIEYY